VPAVTAGSGDEDRAAGGGAGFERAVGGRDLGQGEALVDPDRDRAGGDEGEEFGRHKEGADFQWILDPIDGTKPFTLGRPSFGCLIALHHWDQGFVLGICDQPVTNERWVGAFGHLTTYNGQTLPQREEIAVDRPLRAGFTNPLRFKKPLQQCHDLLVTQRAVVAYGGDCLNFAGIANGWLDITGENNQSLYDVAPFVTILRGVGAVITQTDGSPISLTMGDGVLAAATPELHQKFLQIATSV
jgi:fructose-1,6-bisphosphatase/inositol monophosphatase family enzyme